MESGRERNIISPLEPGAYMPDSSSKVLSQGFGKINAEELIDRTSGSRILPRENLNPFASSQSPFSKQKGMNVKEELSNA